MGSGTVQGESSDVSEGEIGEEKIAKKQGLFEDEADLQETINFWKYHKRM
jgi:hypothetical protein